MVLLDTWRGGRSRLFIELKNRHRCAGLIGDNGRRPRRAGFVFVYGVLGDIADDRLTTVAYRNIILYRELWLGI